MLPVSAAPFQSGMEPLSRLHRLPVPPNLRPPPRLFQPMGIFKPWITTAVVVASTGGWIAGIRTGGPSGAPGTRVRRTAERTSGWTPVKLPAAAPRAPLPHLHPGEPKASRSPLPWPALLRTPPCTTLIPEGPATTPTVTTATNTPAPSRDGPHHRQMRLVDVPETAPLVIITIILLIILLLMRTGPEPEAGVGVGPALMRRPNPPPLPLISRTAVVRPHHRWMKSRHGQIPARRHPQSRPTPSASQCP